MLDPLSQYLLLGALVSGPAYLGVNRGLDIMEQKHEPLDVRLQKVRMDLDTGKFAEFRKEREKIAFDYSSWSSPLAAPLFGAALQTGLTAPFSAVSEVTKPTSGVFGTKLYRYLFPGLEGMSTRMMVPEESLKSFATSGAKEVGKSMGMGMSKIIGKLIEKNNEVIVSSPRRKLIFDQLRREDDLIAKIPIQAALESYGTMVKTAPTLSMDKNAVKSFLRSIAMAPEGGIDWNTIKGIADAESSLLKAKELKAKV